MLAPTYMPITDPPLYAAVNIPMPIASFFTGSMSLMILKSWFYKVANPNAVGDIGSAGSSSTVLVLPQYIMLVQCCITYEPTI